MNVRWTFKAATDRAPQCESRFPYPAPKEAVKKNSLKKSEIHNIVSLG